MKQRNSSNLRSRSKICPVCGLPFTWRKKWAKDWDNVKYCSLRCRRRRFPNQSKQQIST